MFLFIYPFKSVDTFKGLHPIRCREPQTHPILDSRINKAAVKGSNHPSSPIQI